jgi:hypothetical protein
MEDYVDVSNIKLENKDKEIDGEKMFESVKEFWDKGKFKDEEKNEVDDLIYYISELAKFNQFDEAVVNIMKPYDGKYNQNQNKDIIKKDVKDVASELLKNFIFEFPSTISQEKIKVLETRRDEKQKSVDKAQALLNLHPDKKQEFEIECDKWKKEHEFMKNARQNIEKLENTRKKTEQKTGDTYRFRSYETRLDNINDKLKEKEKRLKIILGEAKLNKKNKLSQEEIQKRMLQQFKDYNIDFDVCKSLYIDGFSYAKEDVKEEAEEGAKEGKLITIPLVLIRSLSIV